MFHIKQLMSSVSKNVCLAVFFASVLCAQAWAETGACGPSAMGTCEDGKTCTRTSTKTSKTAKYECLASTCSGDVKGVCNSANKTCLLNLNGHYECMVPCGGTQFGGCETGFCANTLAANLPNYVCK